MNLPELNSNELFSKQRVAAFDGLRGVAVLAVMLHHLSFYCPVNTPLAELTRKLLHAGWCGVDLFFVLSGFLITGILLDTRGNENYFRAFYASRALRTFPAYYLTLIAVLVASKFSSVVGTVLPQRHDRIFYFFYLNNWWALMGGLWRPNIIGHFWSLAVEEQFYLLFPFIPRFFARRQVAMAALTGIVLAPVIRTAIYLHWGPVRDIVENLFCRMDSLLMGALIASLARSSGNLSGGRWILRCLALVAGLAFGAGSFSRLPIFGLARSELFIFSGLAVILGCLILETFVTREKNTLFQRSVCWRPLRFAGKYSYGIYLYHVPLLWLCARCCTRLEPARDLMEFMAFSGGVMALTIAAAKLSYDFFEIRFLKRKSQFP